MIRGCSGGPDVIIRVLLRRRQAGQSDRRRCDKSAEFGVV